MIVTPEQLIKQYFPEPIETTRELYDRLDLESVYPYLDWLRDAETYCLSKFVEDVDYKPLPDAERNFWIGQKVFWTLIQSSPSEICQQIRRGLLAFTNKVATDRDFARQYQEQLDREHGVEKVSPRVSKKLKAKYNETGEDSVEFSVEADSRLHINILSGYNFQPGQKIKDVIFNFRMKVEQGVPFHIVEAMLSLNNDDILNFRAIWYCNREQPKYGAMLVNKLIRVNLFGDNRKLVDSYDYVMSQVQLQTLEGELKEVISMLLDINLDGIDVDQLGEKILRRHNMDGQAYALAIRSVLPEMAQFEMKQNTDKLEAAFTEAVNKYWESYVLRPDPTNEAIEDLEQMANDRVPRVVLASTAAKMLDFEDLCERYFKRSYSDRQVKKLSQDAIPRLLYVLSGAGGFDPTATPEQRIVDMCAFIADQLDSMQAILTDMGQWPK
ncbi:MAG: hypothetical protein ABFD08_00070 [Syntrophomonas sp.]